MTYDNFNLWIQIKYFYKFCLTIAFKIRFIITSP